MAELLQEKQREFAGQMEIQLAVNMLYYICQIRVKGQESILIRGNGNVIPHCTLSSLVMGNVHHQSLREIWDTRLARLSEDPRLIQVLEQHEIVRTGRLGQLRGYRRLDA